MFRKTLYEVAEDLTSAESKRLAALLRDHDVPKVERERIVDSDDLLTLMEYHGILAEDCYAELESMLEVSGHESTLDILAAARSGVSRNIQQESRAISNPSANKRAATFQERGELRVSHGSFIAHFKITNIYKNV